MNASNVAHALLRAASRLISTPEASRNAPARKCPEGAQCATEEDTLAMLRESHCEPIPEAHYAAVRAHVLSRIGLPACPRAEGASRVWRILIPAFTVAIAAALLLGFWPSPSVHPKASPIAAVPSTSAAQAQALPPQPVPAKSRTVRMTQAWRAHRRQPVTGVIGPPDPRPLVVKVITDDPSIVIYWISERTGE